MNPISLPSRTYPTYPAISNSGEVWDAFDGPLWERPDLISDFGDPYIDPECEDNALSAFMYLLENDLDFLGHTLRGEAFDDYAILLVHLPKVIQMQNPSSKRVVLMLYNSAIRRSIIVDQSARGLIHFFTPYTWDGYRFKVFKADEPNFHAQALFGVDHNVTVGMQADLTAMLQSLSSSALQQTENFTSYLSVACKLFIMFKHIDDPLTLGALFIDLALSYGITLAMAQSAWNFIEQNCGNLFRPGFQAQVADGESIRSTSMLIATMCALLGSSQLPSQKMIDMVLYRTSLLGRAMSGYKTITDTFKGLFNVVYNVCYEHLFGIPPDRSELDQYLDQLSSWYDEVVDLTQLDVHDNISMSYELCRRIERAYAQGLDFTKRLDSLKLTPQQKEPFMRFWLSLVKVYDRVIGQGSRKSEPRTEPVIVHLFGSSGVGKSGLVYLLAQDICAAENMAEAFMEETYFRNVEQEFWDGYHGQMICVYDDFGQMRDVPGSPNPEFMEVIRTRNIAPWPLHMAHLEEKARTRFTSRACILTSNNDNFKIDSLTHEDAFKRRIDLKCEVALKPEFQDENGRLDTSKVSDPLDKNVYRFCLYKDTTPNKSSKTSQKIWFSYDELSRRVVAKYKSCFHESKRRMEFLQERAKLFKAQVNMSYTFDRIVFPVVWIGSKRKCETSILLRENIISSAHLRELEGLAATSQDYYEFLEQAVNYCLAQGLDLCKEFDTDVDWNVYSTRIYNEDEVVSERKNNSRSRYFRMQFSRLRDSIIEWWEDVRKNAAGKLIGFGAIVAAILGVYTVKKMISKPKKPNIGTIMRARDFKQYSCESREIEKRPRAKYVTESRELEKRPRRQFVSEAAIDNNSQELVYSSIASNVYLLYSKRNDEFKRTVNCMFVKGRTLLIVGHAKMFLGEECILRNTWHPDGIYFRLRDCKMIPLHDSDGEQIDAMLMELPRIVPSHKDITKHFSSREDLSSFVGIKGNLYTCKELTKSGRKTIASTVYPLSDVRAIDCEAYSLNNDIYHLRKGYIYSAETMDGDCSSPLIASNHGLSRKILGIHVAGAPGQGIAQVITQRILEKGFEQCSFEAQISFDLDTLPIMEDAEPQLPVGNFIPLGKCELTVPAAVKTDIQVSPLHGKIKEPSSKPALLKPTEIDGQVVDPLLRGLQKCGVTCRPIDNAILERCKRAVLSKIQNSRIKSEKKVFSLAEAITGIEGDEFLKPINRASSPGFPWIFQRQGQRGKTKWLGSDQEYILDDPDVVSSCNARFSLATKGVRVPTLWIDTLKDERRPIEKVNAGKTRVFSAGSMDYILTVRRYFLSFNAHMMRNRIDNESAVGINPYSADWHRLALHLMKKGPSVIAGDFSNFDGTLHPDILWACLDIINEWYDDSEENKHVRTVLFQDIVNSCHIFGNNIYQWTHSQPSGNPLTAILNTLYNVISMRYVFVDVTGLSLKDFERYVSMIAFGDDNCVNISNSIIDEFNQVTIAAGYKKLGMTYTDESKTGEIVPFRSLSTVSFLKRSFRRDADLLRYVGPLELDVVLEMPMWVKSSLDHDYRCSTTLEKAYGELAIHGPEVFARWTPFLHRLAQENLQDPPLLYSYFDYLGKDLEH